MQNKLFLKAADVCELLEVSTTSAYEIIANLCYPAFYLVLYHATFNQIKKGHSINYSDGFFIGLLYAVPLCVIIMIVT